MSKFRYIFSSFGSGRPYCRKEDGTMARYRTTENLCVVFNGSELVYAREAERYTKKKHDFARPRDNLRMFRAYYPDIATDELEEIEDVIDDNHHENHIYEAFYQSGFHEAAALVNDGYGNLEESVTLAYMQEGESPRILRKFPRSSSICVLYNYASLIVFGSDYSEGKLMGLAGYGKRLTNTYASWDEENKNIIRDIEQLKFDLKESMPCKNDVMSASNVALTVQRNFEDVMVGVVRYFRDILDKNGINTKNLCMSGGGILNCPTNSKIVDLGLFENYYASPQPSDGCAESIGRFFKVMQKRGESLESRRLESAYLGVTYPYTEVPTRKFLLNEPIDHMCNYLKRGGVIAWFQDGAEYGPRALGHRSFLADPSDAHMLEVLNKIKGREMWRPLVPIVPEEIFKHIFEVENTDMCEFMLRTSKVKEKWRDRLSAVCHIDGTTRPQLLKKEVNPLLYELLISYFERYKVPCLINTSLNINGFPIVETPSDFCDLLEEIDYMENIPTVKGIFTEGLQTFEVFPCEHKETRFI